MLKSIRRSKLTKGTSLLLSLLLIQPYFAGFRLMAHAGGPTQPEYAKYTTLSNSDFVDPFTGNVGYSVPLFEIGGYPVTLSYTGDINPSQDAGWVGLGWSLNLGSVNRALRGVPDDFDGDKVVVERNSRPSISTKVVFNDLKSEVFGSQLKGMKYFNTKTLEYDFTILWDNNTGIGIGAGASWELSNSEEHNRKDYSKTLGYDTLYRLNGPYKIPQLLEYHLPKYGNLDTSFSKLYGVQMGVNYNSKSRTSLSTSFFNNSGKHSLLGNGQISYNSMGSQFDLGFQTGYRNVNLVYAYSSNFCRSNVIQVPFPETITRNYTLKLDFSRTKGVAVNQKRKFSGIVNIVEEHLIEKTKEFQSYGYFNLRDGNYEKSVILDVEEFPNSIGPKMDDYSRVLSPATKTYDVFNVSAAGIGGSFRAHHGSVFMLSPATVEMRPYVNNLSLKGEFGNNEIGIDIGIGVNSGKYGTIPKGKSQILENLRYKPSALNSLYEPYSVRNDYEFIEADMGFYSGFGGTSAMTPKPKGKLGQYESAFFNSTNNNLVNVNGAIYKENREARQQMVTCNNAQTAAKTSLFKQIGNYWFDQYGNPQVSNENRPQVTFLDRVSLYRKAHHLSEIVVTQPNGVRYYFSNPVYIKTSKEVTFDASELNRDTSMFNYLEGLIKYNPTDIKKDKKGNSARFYEAKTMPAYASTFLLNGIISPDYVDVDGNGPSESDLGNYVKFNYSLHRSSYNNNDGGVDSAYRWRMPMEYGKAFYSQGYKSDKLDDRAYYSYGEKELWYAHSIETKDQIAFFYLRPRLDGWEVHGEMGGIKYNGKTQMYLQQIVVFSKNEFFKDGFSAMPLKTINFDYSYDLCRNYPAFKYYNNTINNTPHPLNPLTGFKETNRGKLTLHKVWFTYGRLGVNTSSPIEFRYVDFNPSFKYRSVDRWGTYMPSELYQGTGLHNDEQLHSTADRPYTPQEDRQDADKWAGVWMLNEITLPTGGKIQFEFEADDYRFVQDRNAMKMVSIIGWNNKPEYNMTGDDLYTPKDGANKNYYLIFLKPDNHNAADYYKPGDLVYYNMDVKLRKGENNSAEQVSGFFEVDEIGNATDNSNYGYIKVKPERAGIFNAHPVTRMAIQYGLSNVPFNLYPGSDLRRSPHNVKTISDMILGVLPDLVTMFTGKYLYFEVKGFCQEVNTDKSFIRIPVLDGCKFGGGHRVKKVTLSDNWNAMTSGQENSSEYSLEYHYVTIGQDGSGSSGVASYEPYTGADENPFKEPLNAEAIKNLRQKRFKPLISYDLGPIGEEFIGAPIVGYSRIEVRNVYPNSSIIKHKSGYTVKEFYTAKDFPVVAEHTPIHLKKFRVSTPNLRSGTGVIGDDSAYNEAQLKAKTNKADEKAAKFSLDVSASFNYMTAGQGMAIETNDMHGKPKSDLVYSEDGLEPISGSRFFYKKQSEKRLDNQITVLRQDCSISTTVAGLTIDPTIYGSQKTSSIHNIRPNINTDRTGAALLFNILPGYSLHREQTRLMTATKHIMRRGIVDSVVVYDKGASTSTKNLAWDALTGQVLLSSVNNEYGDVIYSLAKPAHWMYDGMKGAYLNQGLEVELTISSGVATDPTNALFKGDELYLSDLSSTSSWYVLDRSSNQVSLINSSGNSAPNGTYKFKIKRSGHRNILGELTEAITLMKNPLDFQNGVFSIDPDWVVDAKAFVYSDIRKVLPIEKFCFYSGCVKSYSAISISDTTGFGFQVLNANGAIIPPINNPYMAGPNYFGRPIFSDCCLGGGFGSQPTYEGLPCRTIIASERNSINDIVNPYLLGIRGIWMINGEYVYFEKRNNYAQRTQDLSNSADLNTTTMRYDGRLKDYKEFWTYAAGVWTANSAQQISNPWTWKHSLTDVEANGTPLQSVDALGIYSAQLFGYGNRRLLTSQAVNAKSRNIMFESFEDISTDSYLDWHCDSATGNLLTAPVAMGDWNIDFIERYRHWPVSKSLMGGNNRVTDKTSHTGWNSLQLSKGVTEVTFSPLDNTNASPNNPLLVNYRLQKQDITERFFPEQDKYYLLSLWVKESLKGQFNIEILDQFGNILVVEHINTAASIDGWRQISLKFNLAAGQDLGSIKFLNRAPNSDMLEYCYIDDMRIMPMNSGMNCYVYDKNKYRVMATLDDNNYATFYEYDEEGVLVRKKVETEKGIMTISEERKNTRK